MKSQILKAKNAKGGNMKAYTIANFAVRRVAGVIDDMQFSTAIARTYYRNILQQLEQPEA